MLLPLQYPNSKGCLFAQCCDNNKKLPKTISPCLSSSSVPIPNLKRSSSLLHNASLISWAEKPCQSQSVPYRWFCVPSTLQSYCNGLIGLHVYCDHETVHWCTYNVRSYQRNPKGCTKYILLDSSHIYIILSPLEKGWD